MSSLRCLTVVDDKHEFCPVSKQLKNSFEIKKWERSHAYAALIEFIELCGDACKGKSLETEVTITEHIQRILDLLTSLEGKISSYPPVDNPQRYGNIAFRDWHDHLTKESQNLCETMLEGCPHSGAAVEIRGYLDDSFGNRTRMDYGTGHELHFIAFLACLMRIGFVTKEDCLALGNVVFVAYLQLCRRVQTVYQLEPAGSQGVWALDDYQFIAFILGAAQLIDSRDIETPSRFPEPGIIESYANKYTFIGCLKYITTVKTGPFAEHSMQLWNISAVPFWHKVYTGLIKMYRGEVLSKFPVVQHFLYGSLLKYEIVPPLPPKF